MVVANALAYNNTATITTVISFIAHALGSSLTLKKYFFEKNRLESHFTLRNNDFLNILQF
jgi:hypothetical protein